MLSRWNKKAPEVGKPPVATRSKMDPTTVLNENYYEDEKAKEARAYELAEAVKQPEVKQALAEVLDEKIGGRMSGRAKGGRGKATGRHESWGSMFRKGFKRDLERAAKRAGMPMNALLEELLDERTARAGAPAAEQEAGRRRQLVVWATEDTVKGLRVMAEAEGMSVSELIERLAAARLHELEQDGAVRKQGSARAA